MPLKAKKRYIVTEPQVFVIGSQRIHKKTLDRFLRSEGCEGWTTDATQPGEILAEVAGRVCYLSFAGGRKHLDYVTNLKADRHGSVLEHATVTFILTGVSRSFTHECVRHRAGWAYSQLSQRFVDESQAQFVMPWAVARCRKARRLWTDMVKQCHSYYATIKAVLESEHGLGDDFHDNPKERTRLRKLVNGAARSLLPNATETKIACTVNARALRHFLEMRASQAADHEIRSVAIAIFRAVRPLWPDILGDYVTVTDESGVEYLTTDFPKV